MTWRELQAGIAKIPEAQMDNKVEIWEDDYPAKPVFLDSTDEAYYSSDEEDYCLTKSEIPAEELDDWEKVHDKGFFHLAVNY